MSAFRIENGRSGRKLVVTGVTDQRLWEEIASAGCEELELNYAKGWKGSDLSGLSALSGLKGLIIFDPSISDVNAIGYLENLRHLELHVYCRYGFDFAKLRCLEECYLEWHPSARSIFDCPRMRDLFINRLSRPDLTDLSPLVSLEILGLGSCKAHSLNGIQGAKHLSDFRLTCMRSLNDASQIAALGSLKRLCVQQCRGFEDLAFLAGLDQLASLMLEDIGPVATLAPLRNLKALDTVLLIGSTNVLDGDLSVLDELPLLKTIGFQNRKHYNRKAAHYGVA